MAGGAQVAGGWLAVAASPAIGSAGGRALRLRHVAALALPWLLAAGSGAVLAVAVSAAAFLRAELLAASTCPPAEWLAAAGAGAVLAGVAAAFACRPLWLLRTGALLATGSLVAMLSQGLLPAAVTLVLALVLLAVAIGVAAGGLLWMSGLPPQVAPRWPDRSATPVDDEALANAVAAFPRRRWLRRCGGALVLAAAAAALVATQLRWPSELWLQSLAHAVGSATELAALSSIAPASGMALPELPWLALWLPIVGVCWLGLLWHVRSAARAQGMPGRSAPGSAGRARVGCAVFAGALPGMVALVCLAITGGAPCRLEPPHSSLRFQVLASAGQHHVVYDRATQELQLQRGTELVLGEGPDRPHAELLATLVRSLVSPGDRVALLGLGSGRLPVRLQRATGDLLLDLIDARSEARSLLGMLQAEGPVLTGWREELPASRLRGFAGFLPALQSMLPASRQVVVLGEPLHQGSRWQVAFDVQQALRRIVGMGVVLQPLALDRAPPELVASLLVAAAAAHPWNAMFAVGHTAVLVSAVAEPCWPTAAAVAQWPADARWQAHAAHLDPSQDLPLACLGVVLSAPVGPVTLAAPSSIVAVNRNLLRRWLAPLPAVAAGPHSLLEYWRCREADLQAAERALGLAGTSGEDTALVGEAATVPAAALALAARFLPIGAPRAGLQAALGLADAQGVRLRNRELATRCAHALDPTFGAQRLPPSLRELPVPADPTGPLEDLARLPFGERMVAWCSGEQPRAVALRSRFPTAAARALVEALAQGPLPPAGMQALRELADPVVLAAAVAAVAARGEPLQALAFWRGDLPLPASLAAAYHADPAYREPLLLAVTGRRDAGSRELLAEGLVASEPRLRRVAAGVLRDTVGNTVDYDPDWPASQRLAAAERLRTLHNRTP